MIYRLVLRGAFAAALLCSLAPAAAQPITVDTANPQYFRFNNQTIPLVGFSGEYICHIANPGASADICTYDNQNYETFVDELAGHGLNKFRLWVGLNHSPGKMRPYPNNVPLDFEQPFKWVFDSSTGQWRWNLDQWEPEYFTRLKNVITYARDKMPSIIVEVTFFDPWSGTFATSPWNAANIVQTAYQASGGIGFTQERYFVTYDNGTSDLVASNQNARARQLALVDKIANELRNFNNVYYEISNEPDISAGNSVTGANVANWHATMIQRLRNYEASQGISPHLIGVNYHTSSALATVLSSTNQNRFAKVVSAHYAGLFDSTRYSALKLIQSYHNGGATELNRAFGFNETKAICCVGSPSTPTGARAEAWEFMLNEGGMIDHYSLDWNSTDAGLVFDYLGALKVFLTSFDLRNVQRVAEGSPSSPPWMGYHGPQNICSITPLGTNCHNWASIAKPGQQYGLYYHRGQISGDTFKHYNVPAPGSHTLSLSLNNLGALGTFKYEWIEPSTGALKCPGAPCTGTISWSGSGTVSLVSPSYGFDIALRLTRQ